MVVKKNVELTLAGKEVEALRIVAEWARRFAAAESVTAPGGLKTVAEYSGIETQSAQNLLTAIFDET